MFIIIDFDYFGNRRKVGSFSYVKEDSVYSNQSVCLLFWWHGLLLVPFYWCQHHFCPHYCILSLSSLSHSFSVCSFFYYFYYYANEIWSSSTPFVSDRVNGQTYYLLDGDQFKVSSDGGVSFSPTFSFPLSSSGRVQVHSRPGVAGEVWVCTCMFF